MCQWQIHPDTTMKGFVSERSDGGHVPGCGVNIGTASKNTLLPRTTYLRHEPRRYLERPN